jgi:hypothetical protein
VLVFAFRISLSCYGSEFGELDLMAELGLVGVLVDGKEVRS